MNGDILIMGRLGCVICLSWLNWVKYRSVLGIMSQSRLYRIRYVIRYFVVRHYAVRHYVAFGVMSFGIMSHSALCHIRNYVIRYYVVPFGIMSHSGSCRSAYRNVAFGLMLIRDCVVRRNVVRPTVLNLNLCLEFIR